ncbi:30S ribosomal protein S3 [Candidatus Woesearchaeota archaeon]|nr:30S ribosomal protein S3 [Candidatus Woesearchaeota archaeon]
MQNKIIKQKVKELEIQEFVESNLSGVGLSTTNLQVTPMAEKIIINTSRPGLVVGRKGQSIKKMTSMLKKKFNLDNPQIEINEVTDINTDPVIVAERIANTLERYGASRFKGIGHRTMEDAMNSGALGIEILISGKIPSSRAKRWRFYQGYLKKCGDIAVSGVKTAYKTALLKTGLVGIQVRIMPADIKLPDDIKFTNEIHEIVEEIDDSHDSPKQGGHHRGHGNRQAEAGQADADTRPVAVKSTEAKPVGKKEGKERSSDKKADSKQAKGTQQKRAAKGPETKAKKAAAPKKTKK